MFDHQPMSQGRSLAWHFSYWKIQRLWSSNLPRFPSPHQFWKWTSVKKNDLKNHWIQQLFFTRNRCIWTDFFRRKVGLWKNKRSDPLNRETFFSRWLKSNQQDSNETNDLNMWFSTCAENDIIRFEMSWKWTVNRKKNLVSIYQPRNWTVTIWLDPFGGMASFGVLGFRTGHGEAVHLVNIHTPYVCIYR